MSRPDVLDPRILLSQQQVFEVRLFHPQLTQSSLSTLDEGLLNNDLWIRETHHKQQIQTRSLKVLVFLRMDYPYFIYHLEVVSQTHPILVSNHSQFFLPFGYFDHSVLQQTLAQLILRGLFLL